MWPELCEYVIIGGRAWEREYCNEDAVDGSPFCAAHSEMIEGADDRAYEARRDEQVWEEYYTMEPPC